MVDLHQQFLLRPGVLDLLFLYDVVLVQRFDGEDRLSLFVLAEHHLIVTSRSHLAKGTPSQHSHWIEVVHGNLTHVATLIQQYRA